MKYSYWYWKNFFSKKEINLLNNIINLNSFKGVDVPATNVKKTSEVKMIEYKYLKNHLEDLFKKIYVINQSHFDYDIFNPAEEDLLLYNVYKDGKEYDWHIDEASDPYIDIKLTVLINLSNIDYSGGEFCLKKSNELILKNEFNEPGDVILLKSYIMHKVKPISKGERNSLTYFIKGPNFK